MPYNAFEMPRKRDTVETLPAWRLVLLGSARLERGEKAQTLERLSALLLAYLALEGPSARSLLAGLLWPDRAEEAARANLRQRLKRLRDAVGADLISSEEILRLRPDLEVDAVQLESLAFTGEYAKALAFQGEFLAGHDYADCDDLQAWVEATRERLTGARAEAYETESVRLEREGELAAATALAERLLEIDPYLEDAHRRLMRLRYLTGDRAGALRAYARCRSLLEQELGVALMPETLELAALIERGAAPAQVPSGQTRPSIPLSVLRPPRLAGRSSEWAQLEAAWQNGRVIVVRGEPGLGKTRLVRDFLAAKLPPKSSLVGQARPGDADVPYATHARLYRQMLEQYQPELEPWVRAELSRIIPELGETPEPIRNDADEIQFFEACASALRACFERGMRAVLTDDVQFADAGTIRASAYFSLQNPLLARGLRAIWCHRAGELAPELEGRIEEAVRAGAVALVTLKPLGADAVREMVASLELPNADAVALGTQIACYAGGNPMFALETIKHLIETRGLGVGVPERLPPPESIKPLVQRRLERLSKPALRLARVAAVAGTDFDLSLAARVLETNALDLTDDVAELEAAQVMSGNTFAHDLIFEATLEDVSRTVRAILHRHVAEHLESIRAHPGRVAHHWLEGGDEERAVPQLLEAAQLARLALQPAESSRLYRRAASILEGLGDRSGTFRALAQAVGLSIRFEPESCASLEDSSARLVALADGASAQAEAWRLRAALLNALNRFVEAEAAARAGQSPAVDSRNVALRAALQRELATALFRQDRLVESLELRREVFETHERTGTREERLVASIDMAFVLDRLNRYRDALDYHRRALELNAGRADMAATLSKNYGISLQCLGLTRDSADHLTESLRLFRRSTDHAIEAFTVLTELIQSRYLQGDYRTALSLLGEALLVSKANAMYQDFVHLCYARVYLGLGQHERSGENLKQARASAAHRGHIRGAIGLVESQLALELGLDPHSAISSARRELEPIGDQWDIVRLLVAEASILPPSQALSAARSALEASDELELGGLQVAAATRCAQALLGSGLPIEALEHARRATSLLETYDPISLTCAEVLFTHHRALEANGHPDARAALETALGWVLETATHRVPPEFRDSFLTRNPVNRAILEATRAAGLKSVP